MNASYERNDLNIPNDDCIIALAHSRIDSSTHLRMNTFTHSRVCPLTHLRLNAVPLSLCQHSQRSKRSNGPDDLTDQIFTIVSIRCKIGFKRFF